MGQIPDFQAHPNIIHLLNLLVVYITIIPIIMATNTTFAGYLSHIYIYGYESKLCMERSALFRTYGTKGFRNWSCSGRWNVMKYKLYININMYTVYMYNILYIIYISRICTLKLLPLAAAHFHFSSARHPCCTPVQRRFALHG